MMKPSALALHQTVQAHLQAARIPQAAEVLRQIVEVYPQDAKGHFMLGVIALQSGRIPDAISSLSRSILIEPSGADPYFLRGLSYQQSHQLTEAVADYKIFLMRKPGDGKALNNLGRAVLDQGKVSEATSLLRRATAALPRNAGAFNNLGEALRTAGDFAGAAAQYRQAIAIDPNMAEAHGNLGALLVQGGDRIAGIASLRHAVAINPRLFNAQVNLARAYIAGGPLEEAARHCRIAIELQPDNAGAHDLMGNVLGLAGLLPQCVAERQRALQLKPDDSSIHGNLLMSLQYLDDVTPLDNFNAHVQWDQKHLSGMDRPRKKCAAGNRRLRIGYVSPNFNSHSVAYFFEPVLMAHDRLRFEIFCYSNLRLGDETTGRIKASCDGWREIAGKSDDDVVELIEQDQIDVLIDLAGHTADNRLPVFAHRPAPVQMTWLGYPASTGMRTMDYRLTDAITDPTGSEAIHTEKLLRLPGGCWAYRAPSSPTVGPPPCEKNGFITFGSFNNLPKVTPRVLATWASLLHRVPASRLILKASGLGSSMGRSYVTEQLQKHDIDPARFELLHWLPTTTSHLQLYDRIDIALDTFPYNGTTTTCEAMWMGVPVVTFAGDSHVARVGAALLTHANCTEWIATDSHSYIGLAGNLANDREGLSVSRRQLRDRMRASELCDANRLAREMESAFVSACEASSADPAIQS